MHGIMVRQQESDSLPRSVGRGCDREGTKLTGVWGSVQFRGAAGPTSSNPERLDTSLALKGLPSCGQGAPWSPSPPPLFLSNN